MDECKPLEPGAAAPEEGFPDPPPGDVSWAQISTSLSAAWEAALEHDASVEGGAGERRIPALADTCKKKDCFDFEQGGDRTASFHITQDTE